MHADWLRGKTDNMAEEYVHANSVDLEALEEKQIQTKARNIGQKHCQTSRVPLIPNCASKIA